MKEKLLPRIGLIGAGRWGQNLIKNFNDIGVLNVIVDSDQISCERLRPLYPDILISSDISVLLSSDVDAVAIATPAFTHFDIAKKALLANKDVFVEKPMTAHTWQAEELIQIAKQQNRILMVGHLLLYQPAIQFMKEFMTSGQLGKIHSVYQTRRNLGTIRVEENVLYSLGVHDLAVLNFLIPEQLQQVKVVSQEIISPNVADDISVHLTYPSIQAHLHLSWLWPYKERQLMILGEKGALHFNEVNQQVYLHRNFGNKDRTLTQLGSEMIFHEEKMPLKLELEHFIDCIKTRRTPLSDGQQGKLVVNLIETIMTKSRSPA